MSNALVVATLLDLGVLPAIRTTWAGDTIDEDDVPRTIQNLPLTSVQWLDVHIGFGGLVSTVTNTNQTYVFQIIRHFVMPPASGTVAGKLSRVKATLASELIANLQTGNGFAGIGVNPIVTHVSAKERSPRFEGAAMLKVLFAVQVKVNYFPTP